MLAAAVVIAYLPQVLEIGLSRFLPLLSGPVAVAGFLIPVMVTEDLGTAMISWVGGLLLGFSLVCAADSLTGKMSKSLDRAGLVSAGISFLFLIGLILALAE